MPLFLIPDFAGLAVEYEALSDALAAQIEVCVLPSEQDLAVRTVEGLATALVDAIRRIQPTGPYRLTGRSVGGVVAYEVAIQLLGQDERVEFLGLIDALHPLFLDSLPAGPNQQALRAYAIRPCPVELRLFVSNDRSGLPGDPALNDAFLGWTASVPGDKIHRTPVSGSYESLLGGDVGELASLIASTVLNVDSRASDHDVESHSEAKFTIQGGRRRNAPIFCVPGAGDHVVQFVEFGAALGDTWPIHGLQHRGLDLGPVPYSTVEAEAIACLRAIDAASNGPVHLVGHSFGGLIVFELALKMAARNRPPRSVTLIDSDPPDDMPVRREYTSIEIVTEFFQMLELVADRPLGIDTEELRQRSFADMVRLVHERSVAVGLLPRSSRAEALEGSIRAFGTALRASYTPKGTYPGRIHLALASNPKLDSATNTSHFESTFDRWKRWAPAAEMWVGPGNHLTILRPPLVQQVADWWQAAVVDSMFR